MRNPRRPEIELSKYPSAAQIARAVERALGWPEVVEDVYAQCMGLPRSLMAKARDRAWRMAFRGEKRGWTTALNWFVAYWSLQHELTKDMKRTPPFYPEHERRSRAPTRGRALQSSSKLESPGSKTPWPSRVSSRLHQPGVAPKEDLTMCQGCEIIRQFASALAEGDLTEDATYIGKLLGEMENENGTEEDCRKVATDATSDTRTMAILLTRRLAASFKHLEEAIVATKLAEGDPDIAAAHATSDHIVGTQGVNQSLIDMVVKEAKAHIAKAAAQKAFGTGRRPGRADLN